jgi:hypothetical protein
VVGGYSDIIFDGFFISGEVDKNVDWLANGFFLQERHLLEVHE